MLIELLKVTNNLKKEKILNVTTNMKQIARRRVVGVGVTEAWFDSWHCLFHLMCFLYQRSMIALFFVQELKAFIVMLNHPQPQLSNHKYVTIKLLAITLLTDGNLITASTWTVPPSTSLTFSLTYIFSHLILTMGLNFFVLLVYSLVLFLCFLFFSP